MTIRTRTGRRRISATSSSRCGLPPEPESLLIQHPLPQLPALLTGQGDGGLTSRGDMGALPRLLGLLETPHPGFAIVAP